MVVPEARTHCELTLEDHRGLVKTSASGERRSVAGRGVHKLTVVYLPKHFAARDRAAVEAFVDAAGAADLVTFDGTKPIASLIPVIWDRPADGGDGRLIGHLALANPQWRSAGPDAVALAIVHGPQAYVSPGWYASHATIP